jgi:hypothetical protein
LLYRGRNSCNHAEIADKSIKQCRISGKSPITTVELSPTAPTRSSPSSTADRGNRGSHRRTC